MTKVGCSCSAAEVHWASLPPHCEASLCHLLRPHHLPAMYACEHGYTGCALQSLVTTEHCLLQESSGLATHEGPAACTAAMARWSAARHAVRSLCVILFTQIALLQSMHSSLLYKLCNGIVSRLTAQLRQSHSWVSLWCHAHPHHPPAVHTIHDE